MQNFKPCCNYGWTALILLFALCPGTNIYAVDTVLVKGKVYTADETNLHATAVVIDDGYIVYVGSDEEALAMTNESSEVINLQQQFLMPGFIDTHNHVFEGASEVGGNCELSYGLRLKQQKRNLERCKYEASESGDWGVGDWLIGYGHQLDELMQGIGNTEPREFVDSIFPDNPVVIMEESSHSMLVNSLALELANIDSNSKHPQGGRVMFSDSTDKPNGILFDNAGDIVMELAWNQQPDNFQVSYEGLLVGMELAAQNGITTIGDGRLYWQRGWYEVWQEALKNNEVIVRTSLRPWIYPEVDMQKQLTYLEKIADNSIDNLLIVSQVKMYIDGVIHFGTAKMIEPYLDSWQEDLPLGLNYIKPETLPQWFQFLDKLGYGVHVHAIGDGGVREVLDAVEKARNFDSKRIYSMTHLELIADEDFSRFVELDVHTDFQAGASYFDKTGWAKDYLGNRRAKKMFAMRKVFNTGANVTFSSDWTVNPLNPLVAISNSVRLKKSRGLPDINTAIEAATINGARALGLESVTGSITVGKFADMVLLNRDITSIEWYEIRKGKVIMTMLQGKIVYLNN